jgi:hypothetical protein
MTMIGSGYVCFTIQFPPSYPDFLNFADADFIVAPVVKAAGFDVGVTGQAFQLNLNLPQTPESARNRISRNCSSAFPWHEPMNILPGCPISGSLTSLRLSPAPKTFPVVYVALTSFSAAERPEICGKRENGKPGLGVEKS